jgi:5'(3')-deoxyribonucleotidase
MEQNTLKANQKIQLKEDLLTSKIGDEIVLMTIESGKYFSINQEGSQIWELIKKPTTAEEVCKELTEEYDVSMEQCLSDTLPFLEKLYKDGLLVLLD